jgi:hypothetical protein
MPGCLGKGIFISDEAAWLKRSCYVDAHCCIRHAGELVIVVAVLVLQYIPDNGSIRPCKKKKKKRPHKASRTLR